MCVRRETRGGLAEYYNQFSDDGKKHEPSLSSQGKQQTPKCASVAVTSTAHMFIRAEISGYLSVKWQDVIIHIK